MSDNLDGFRSRVPTDPDAPPQLTGETADLIKRAIRGSDLEAWVNSHPGAVMYQEAQDDLAAAVNELLSVDDLSSPEARAAHYRARVATGVLLRVDSVLRDARVAYEELKEKEGAGDDGQE